MAADKADFIKKIRQLESGELVSLAANGQKAVEGMDLKKVGERLIRFYDGTIE